MSVSANIGYESKLTGSGGWKATQTARSGAISIDNNVARSGNSSVRIEVAPGDKVGSTAGERAELVHPLNSGGGSITEGVNSGTKYFGFSVLIDKNWDAPGRGSIWQLHGPSGMPPAFTFQASDKFSVKTNGGTSGLDKQQKFSLSQSSLNKGDWVDWIVKINFSVSNSGEVEVFRRDQGQNSFAKVLDVNAPTVMAPNGNPSSLVHKHGLYRDAEPQKNVLWLDNWVRGDSFDDVAGAMSSAKGGSSGASSGGSSSGGSSSGGDGSSSGGGGSSSQTGGGSSTTNGTSGNELIVGTSGHDELLGLGGDDTIRGQAGDDTIDGGPGGDIINGNSGSDVFVLRDGEGRDVINDYSDGTDRFVLAGGLKFSQLSLSAAGTGTLIKHGGSTLAKINNTNPNELTGADFGDASGSSSSSSGSTSGSTGGSSSSSKASTTDGTNGNDIIIGSSDNDNIHGLAGNDTIRGQDGNDTIDGGPGKDIINGNGGSDTFVLRVGDDRDVINDYNDATDAFSLAGGLSFNQLSFSSAGSGTEIKSGGSTLAKVNNTTPSQFTAEDFGGNSSSSSSGSAKPGSSSSSGSSSVITGTSADEKLFGSDADDYLIGLNGDDTIRGNNGNDVIDGGDGNDIINGSGGSDIFVLRAGDGRDVINDFQNGSDTFALVGSLKFNQLTLSSSGSATLIENGGETLAKVNNVSPQDLTSSDFITETGVPAPDGMDWAHPTLLLL
jgi:Ca2+-binding RTX toxin-like protein